MNAKVKKREQERRSREGMCEKDEIILNRKKRR